MSDFDISRIDLDHAYRIARARGLAERSRVAHRLFGAAARGVRHLLSAPDATGRRTRQ